MKSLKPKLIFQTISVTNFQKVKYKCKRPRKVKAKELRSKVLHTKPSLNLKRRKIGPHSIVVCSGVRLKKKESGLRQLSLESNQPHSFNILNQS